MLPFRIRERRTTAAEARRQHERRRRLRGDDVLTGGEVTQGSVLGRLARAYLNQTPRGR